MATQINHSEYQKKVKGLTEESLLYIIKDANEALKNFPEGEKAGYYQDEINYCSSELKARRLKLAPKPKSYIYNVTDIEAKRTYKATFDNEPTELQLEELKDWYVNELGTINENIKIEKA